MKSRLAAVALAVSAALGAQTPQTLQSWQTAQPGYRFVFPRDHFSHPDYQTEWWYYTGNLRAANGHLYGFELTFFRQAQHIDPQTAANMSSAWRPDQIYLAHLALSDIDGGRFFHTERLNRAGPGLAGATTGAGSNDERYWNGNWQVRWISLETGEQELQAVTKRFTLRLDLRPAKPPVIQGRDGVSRKGPLAAEASHYISFTRLLAKGRLTEGNDDLRIGGTAWMDHEFFTEPENVNLIGWDWFAIQLANNEEFMLYQLRLKSGAPDPYSSGTFVDSAGTAHPLTSSEFQLTAGATWRSPHSGARYPLEWHIHVPSLALELAARTALPDQELWSAESVTPGYWEGAVSYFGSERAAAVSGVGYLEMTGYGQPVQLSGMRQK